MPDQATILIYLCPFFSYLCTFSMTYIAFTCIFVFILFAVFRLEFSETIEERDGMNKIAQDTFSILLELLRRNPSEAVIPVVFTSIRAFSAAYKHVLFNPQVDYNQELCFTVGP